MKCHPEKVVFYAADGGGGYSFAIGKDIYVPERAGDRVLAVEQWLAGLEDVMGRVLGKLHQRSNQPWRDEEERTKFNMALSSLKHRTKHQLVVLEKHIQGHPDIRAKIQDENGEADQFILLENMINSITESAINMAHLSLVVASTPTGKLLVSDEPFLGDLEDDTQFVSCSPYFFIALTTKGRAGSVQYAEASDTLVNGMNEMIAASGRYWLAGRDKDGVEKYIDHFLRPKPEGKVVFDWLHRIPNGYRI